jgi:hypothetical protein
MGNNQEFYLVDVDILLNRTVQVDNTPMSLSHWAAQLWVQWHQASTEQRPNIRNEIGSQIYSEVFGWSTGFQREITLERDGVLLFASASNTLNFVQYRNFGLSFELLRHLDGIIHLPEDWISHPGSIVFREGAGFPDAIDPRLRIFDLNCWVFLDRAQIEELAGAVNRKLQSLSEEEKSKRHAHPDWYWDMQFVSGIKTHQPDLVLYYGQC